MNAHQAAIWLLAQAVHDSNEAEKPYLHSALCHSVRPMHRSMKQAVPQAPPIRTAMGRCGALYLMGVGDQ